ncbi:uncharacterized protein LOC132202948 [Neocloeon triangulifer]|uniref:uncharacterized protein LOC132202948 n=1 Tax=Neocloeon triangulifer TaxID=2078957 RepID=UPI00286F0B56|nr:uncharacterized protein LOC132202948 [Neocloeon triangulifer]
MKSLLIAVTLLVGVNKVNAEQGVLVDMSSGVPPGIETSCHPTFNPGEWKVDAASNYETRESGALDGQVLVSQRATESCLRMTTAIMIKSDFAFVIKFFVPQTNFDPSARRKIHIFLVTEDQSRPFPVPQLDIVPGWQELWIPLPYGVDFTKKHSIEIFSPRRGVDYLAISWFSLSKENLAATIPSATLPGSTLTTTPSTTVNNVNTNPQITDATTTTLASFISSTTTTTTFNTQTSTPLNNSTTFPTRTTETPATTTKPPIKMCRATTSQTRPGAPRDSSALKKP